MSNYPHDRDTTKAHRRRRSAMVLRCLLLAVIVFVGVGQKGCLKGISVIIQVLSGCPLDGSDLDGPCDAKDPIFIVSGGDTRLTGQAPESAFTSLFNAIVVDPRTGNLFAGGGFESIDNVVVQNFARYDTITDRWSSAGGKGITNNLSGGSVNTMVVSGQYIYVGGRISRTVDGSATNLNGIARYDIDNDTWSPLAAGGLKGAFGGPASVYSIVTVGTDLIVGGTFVQTFDDSVTNLNNIARYNTITNTWSALPGNGVNAGFPNGNVSEMTVSGGDIFVGGTFSQTANGSLTNLRNIARFNTAANTWTPLAGNGLNGTVNSVAVSGNDLFVAGSFNQTFTGSVTNIWRIARYNTVTNTWSALSGLGLNSGVLTVRADGEMLYAGGDFSGTQDNSTTGLNRIARYNTATNTWSTLPGGGLDQMVNTLSIVDGSVYLGGNFRNTFDVSNVTEINGILRFDPATNTWYKMGLKEAKALDGPVLAVEDLGDGNLGVGGLFTKAADGTGGLNGLAFYVPSNRAWITPPSDGMNGSVQALVRIGDNLYVGGSFTSTFTNSHPNLNNIARYNISSGEWSALAQNGLNNTVLSMAAIGTDLYVGGFFTASSTGGTTNLNRIARYDTLTNTWSPLAQNGLNGGVTGLAAAGSTLFAGGAFSMTATGATTNLNNIARFNTVTNTWSAMPNNGLIGMVNNLYANDGVLSLNGNFTATHDGMTPLAGLATFDTATNQWDNVEGTPANLAMLKQVEDTALEGNELYIGGMFTEVDSGVARYFTRIYLQQWKVPSSNSDWDNAANWTTGVVPVVEENVVIPSVSGNIDIINSDPIVGDMNMNGGTLNIGTGRTLLVRGTLSLNGGRITGEGRLIINRCNSEAVLGGGPNAYVTAEMVRCTIAGETTTFPVGTANGYSPVTFRNVIGAGSVLVRAQEGPYAGAATGLPASRLARWWHIEDFVAGVQSANVIFNYRQGDVSGNKDNYQAYRISGGSASPVPGQINSFANFFNANATAFSDWTLAIPTGGSTPTPTPSPTATPTPTPAPTPGPGVTVTGRVFTPMSQGLRNAVVSITDPSGSVRTVTTNSFGFYTFNDVPTGQMYTIRVTSKRYRFAAAIRTVTAAINDLDFIGLE